MTCAFTYVTVSRRDEQHRVINAEPYHHEKQATDRKFTGRRTQAAFIIELQLGGGQTVVLDTQHDADYMFSQVHLP